MATIDGLGGPCIPPQMVRRDRLFDHGQFGWTTHRGIVHSTTGHRASWRHIIERLIGMKSPHVREACLAGASTSQPTSIEKQVLFFVMPVNSPVATFAMSNIAIAHLVGSAGMRGLAYALIGSKFMPLPSAREHCTGTVLSLCMSVDIPPPPPPPKFSGSTLYLSETIIWFVSNVVSKISKVVSLHYQLMKISPQK